MLMYFPIVGVSLRYLRGWLWLIVRTYVYMCAHKETGCKGTKKIPYTQIYMGNSFKNVEFASDMRGFGEIEWMDSENTRQFVTGCQARMSL